MIPELENPTDPMDDIDDGYGDEKDVSVLSSEPVNPQTVANIFSVVRKNQQRHGIDDIKDGPSDFGEVEDPDDDDTPDPESFLG